MANKRAHPNDSHSYITPDLSRLYGKPPYEYRDSAMLLVQFQTNPKILRSLGPNPLMPNKDNNLFVSVGDFLCSGVGRYYEAHLFTHAMFKRRRVNYSIYLILDSDVASGAGREIWGFPKKLGQLAMEIQNDVVNASVERGGRKLIEVAMQLAEFAVPGELSGTPEWVTRKLVPSVSLNAPPEIDQLTSSKLTNTALREVHKGPATLSFGASPADRLAEIAIKKVVGGFYYRTDFTLGDGAVVHNYPADH